MRERESIRPLLEGLTKAQLREVKERCGIVITNARRKEDYVYWLDWVYTVQGRESVRDEAERIAWNRRATDGD